MEFKNGDLQIRQFVSDMLILPWQRRDILTILSMHMHK